jgi:hypothetical protein
MNVHPEVFARVPQFLQLQPEGSGQSQPAEDMQSSGVLQEIRCQYSLELVRCRLHDELFAMVPAARPHLTAYTVSPQLTRLVLAQSHKLWQSDALQHVFPPGRQLP